MPLDATGVLDEADLRGQETEAEPQADTGWEDVIDGAPAVPGEDPDAKLDDLLDESEEVCGAAGPPVPAESAKPAVAIDQAAANVDYIKLIYEAREEVRVTKAAFDAAKDKAKATKKEWELAVDELTATIDAGAEQLPLFDHLVEAAARLPAPETEVEPPIAQRAEPPAAGPRVDLAGPGDSDDWRPVTLATIGVPQGICKILAENPGQPIVTRGDLIEWCDYIGGDEPLLQILKIGKGKRDKIVAAILAYDHAQTEEEKEEEADAAE